MFSNFTPPTQTRNYFHSFRLFKLFTLLFLLTFSFSSTHAEEITYKFTNKTWTATLGANGPTANWTSGKDGAGFSNSGIQVTDAASGANGTSPISFENISKIVLTYNTNKSKGEGTAEVKIGDNTATSKKWKYSTGNGTSAKYTLTYDYETPQSGKVKITLNTTKNSIYLVSCTITYNPAPVKSDLTTFAFENATSDIYLTENDGLYEYSGTPQTVNVEPDTYDGTVSYSIDYENSTLTSDEAKIDSKTGEITIKCASNPDSNKTLLIKASATATDNFNAPADAIYTLTVHPASTKTPVNMTAFSATKTTLIVGETTTTTVANDQKEWTAAYTYQSSNSDVASVNESGEITAISKGTATITATLNVSSEDENYRIGNITSKSVEITVNNPSHTAHFSINGTINKNNDCTTEEGESITFPDKPADIYGKKFVGWYGAEYSDAAKEPVYVTSAVMGKDDVTYYAVFANLTPASCTETAISDFSASDVMIIVGKSGDNYYALSNDNGTFKAPTAESVTVENGKITSSVRDNMKWNRKLSGDYYQFYVSNESDYLYCISDNNGVRVGSGNENNKFSITTDGYLKNSGQNRYLGIYNKADWRCYTSINDNIKDQTFTFYKYIARKVSDISTTVKEPATLESIAVTTAPTKTHYFVGETFEPAGMVVTATYDDDDKSSKNVTDYTYSPTGALTTGDHEITISYTERSTTKTTTQAIKVVTPEEAGIAFEKSTVSTPLNSGYTGQALTNPNSLTVAYTSSNPSVATVDGSTGEVTLKATGTTTITASFTHNDTYQSAEVSYELTVTNAVHTITFMVNGKQRSTDIVAEGAAINFPDMANIAGKSVVGWRTSALENVTDTEPADMVTSANMPAADVTYYAVFAKATTTEGASNYTLDYNDKEETISKLTLGYGSSVNYTAKDGGQWVIKVSKQTGMQINKDRDASIKVPNCSGNITSIAITANAGAQKAVGFSSSDYNGTGTPTYLAWGTDGTSQTLDLSSENVKTGYIVPNGGNCQITKIVVNYIGTVNTYSGYCTIVPMGDEDPVSRKYYATYSNKQAFVVPEDVTVAQVVIEKDGLIYLERYAPGNVVAANTGVLLESNKTITTAFKLTNKEATDLEVTNVLKASGAGITADEMRDDNPANSYFYRLTKGTLDEKTVFGFYWKADNGAAFDLGPNKAYMVLPKSNDQAPRYVWLDGQTTAIDGLNADTEATVGSDERIYSLDGRRVEGQLKRGIYVKNGKKFIVR